MRSENMKIYFSHTGINHLKPVLEMACEGTYLDLINAINALPDLVGIKSSIVLEGSLLSSARLFGNVEVIEKEINGSKNYKYYEKEDTFEITQLSQKVPSDVNNILISIFDPAILLHLLELGQAPVDGDSQKFNYIDEEGNEKNTKYLPAINNIDFDFDVISEDIYAFKAGETTLEQLKIKKGDIPVINFQGEEFDKGSSRLLPEDMVDAIREIWELPMGKGALRLFQEDALFFIMARLMKAPYPKEKELLLSMPTGGGKTEAFMIPLLSHIYLEKLAGAEKGVKAIVLYPTNALAIDQAIRFVELLHKINKRLSESGVRREDLISIGLLSKDTPNRRSDLVQESLIKICPCCGKSDKWDRVKAREGNLYCTNVLEDGQICGTNLDFCRLRKEDILSSPPDILITNPDEINQALQSPRYLPLFKTKIEAIVFDEVHIYQGIFGCHIAHLLRRLEEMIEYKPLYIGMSATIGNAKELAALLFDEPLDSIRYMRNENNRYQTDEIVKRRLHALIKPYLRDVRKTKDGRDKNKYVRTMTVALSISLFIAHMIADSHFRKSIVFTNYRADADDLAGYLREREMYDVRQYYNEILEKIQTGKPLSAEDVEICKFMHQWSKVILDKLNNINPEMEVGWNRGGLEKEERIRSIHRFSRNNIMSDSPDDSLPVDIMVATKSLEVGIDIGDVTSVINSSAPFTVNEYVQRVGRGGRKKDSMALTIINPENAIDSYMSTHFKEFVNPNTSSFEDAPIIVNNNVIIERHVKARIADVWNRLYCSGPNPIRNYSLTVSDVTNDVVIQKDGTRFNIGKDVSEADAIKYADALYDIIFSNELDGVRYDDRLLQFIARESEIIGTAPSELDRAQLKTWIRDTIRYLNLHLQEGQNPHWGPNSTVTGFKSDYKELAPSLRGSGATVSLYLEGSENDNAIDNVSRQSAYNSMPVSNGDSVATTKSGISTFRIRDTRYEQDSKTAFEIRKRIIRNDEIKQFYARKLSDFPSFEDPSDFAAMLEVEVPSQLTVSYYPSRFYCPTCKRSLIPNKDYEQKKNGVYCVKCGKKAQQLPKVYMCEDNSCGKLFDPPAPKMCVNPNCNATKKAFQLYKENGYHYKKEMLDFFRFRLTKDLEWVCEDCGCKMNFNSLRMLYDHNKSIAPILQAIRQDDKQSIEGLVYKARYYPEVLNFSDNSLKSRFNCTTRAHKRIKTVGVPRVRTISYSYVGNESTDPCECTLCNSINNNVSTVDFKKGFVIQLANEYMRRFSSGKGDTESYTLKTERIYEGKYWGNYYTSHLAWISFDEVLDEFITEQKYSCDGNCSMCDKFEKPIAIDLAAMMKPQCALEDYNFDSLTQRPKQPDLRGRFCEKAKCNECKDPACVRRDGTKCEFFSKEQFLRYILVHTLKHGLLWATPKYAGVNISEIKGEIYPNDHETGSDVVFIDSNEGGSGAILLLQKHWDQIWSFAREVIGLTAENKANIILPHTCSRNNADLCPFLAKDFFDYLDEK